MLNNIAQDITGSKLQSSEQSAVQDFFRARKDQVDSLTPEKCSLSANVNKRRRNSASPSLQISKRPHTASSLPDPPRHYGLPSPDPHLDRRNNHRLSASVSPACPNNHDANERKILRDHQETADFDRAARRVENAKQRSVEVEKRPKKAELMSRITNLAFFDKLEAQRNVFQDSIAKKPQSYQDLATKLEGQLLEMTEKDGKIRAPTARGEGSKAAGAGCFENSQFMALLEDSDKAPLLEKDKSIQAVEARGRKTQEDIAKKDEEILKQQEIISKLQQELVNFPRIPELGKSLRGKSLAESEGAFAQKLPSKNKNALATIKKKDEENRSLRMDLEHKNNVLRDKDNELRDKSIILRENVKSLEELQGVKVDLEAKLNNERERSERLDEQLHKQERDAKAMLVEKRTVILEAANNLKRLQESKAEAFAKFQSAMKEEQAKRKALHSALEEKSAASDRRARETENHNIVLLAETGKQAQRLNDLSQRYRDKEAETHAISEVLQKSQDTVQGLTKELEEKQKVAALKDAEHEYLCNKLQHKEGILADENLSSKSLQNQCSKLRDTHQHATRDLEEKLALKDQELEHLNDKLQRDKESLDDMRCNLNKDLEKSQKATQALKKMLIAEREHFERREQQLKVEGEDNAQCLMQRRIVNKDFNQKLRSEGEKSQEAVQSLNKTLIAEREVSERRRKPLEAEVEKNTSQQCEQARCLVRQRVVIKDLEDKLRSEREDFERREKELRREQETTVDLFQGIVQDLEERSRTERTISETQAKELEATQDTLASMKRNREEFFEKLNRERENLEGQLRTQRDAAEQMIRDISTFGTQADYLNEPDSFEPKRVDNEQLNILRQDLDVERDALESAKSEHEHALKVWKRKEKINREKIQNLTNALEECHQALRNDWANAENLQQLRECCLLLHKSRETLEGERRTSENLQLKYDKLRTMYNQKVNVGDPGRRVRDQVMLDGNTSPTLVEAISAGASNHVPDANYRTVQALNMKKQCSEPSRQSSDRDIQLEAHQAQLSHVYDQATNLRVLYLETLMRFSTARRQDDVLRWSIDELPKVEQKYGSTPDKCRAFVQSMSNHARELARILSEAYESLIKMDSVLGALCTGQKLELKALDGHGIGLFQKWVEWRLQAKIEDVFTPCNGGPVSISISVAKSLIMNMEYICGVPPHEACIMVNEAVNGKRGSGPLSNGKLPEAKDFEKLCGLNQARFRELGLQEPVGLTRPMTAGASSPRLRKASSFKNLK